jgi:hypothetical protein
MRRSSASPFGPLRHADPKDTSHECNTGVLGGFKRRVTLDQFRDLSNEQVSPSEH